MKEAEREQAQVRTLAQLRLYYKTRIQRVRNVTWRLAYIGACIQTLLVLSLTSLENLHVILLLSSFVIIKSIIGFRNFHVEDLGSAVLQSLETGNK
jgi:hypothetical protein